jgi:sugar phosphate isomerase/epimerase
MAHSRPKLHNAAWPGLVGKGSPGAEPCIDLDTMIAYTAAAEVGGQKFDGMDLFLFDPHISIDASADDCARVAEKFTSRGLAIGSLVAPVWPPTGGGSAMGDEAQRAQFVQQVRKACEIGKHLRASGARSYGVIRIDSADSPENWSKDPVGNTKLIAQTFREAAEVAASYGEKLAAEGEVCWAGMHSWKAMVDTLEAVGRPDVVGFQADLAHTYLYLLGINAPEAALLQPGYSADELDAAYATMTQALRPWTLDFHVAQNDGTVHGSGSHDKTGRHCRADDPNGKLDITKAAGSWLRNSDGSGRSDVFSHICWDGCMFPNAVMAEPSTWNAILAAMVSVRDTHGW